MPHALQEIPHLIIAVSERGLAIGFMGIENGKLEMLFISPEERGKGIGKRFIQHSVETLSVSEVTVNEQNPEAIGFYEHMGFKIYKRTDVDEQDRPYLLLYMER
ncbi:MAG: GNAT family N-acetyltransferase [Floccifex porci]|nr:GNAT family N-acetyltransferase [Floccifex porci]MDD7467549.1 GNAT family N-acetyltransferase [Floccifex porci]